MYIEIEIPRHGLSMSEGTILEWKKHEGDRVDKGETIFSMETDKAVVDIEAPTDGILEKILFSEGETVPVGTVVAILKENERESIEEDKKLNESQSEQMERISASPVARRLASEKGIKLSAIKEGSGPDGRIVKKDVLNYMVFLQEEKEEYIKVNRIKKLTGQRMQKSFQQIPHFYLGMEVEMKRLKEFREEIERDKGKKISYTVFILRAVGKVLRENPLLNSNWEDDKIKINKQVNICLATATDRGLLLPVIPGCDRKTLFELAAYHRDIVERTIQGKLSPEELEGGTFTITNLGMFGIDDFDPIINTPQAGILSVGSIKNRVIAKEDMLAVSPTARFRLAADHRVVDGTDGAKFLNSVKKLLENPEGLMY